MDFDEISRMSQELYWEQTDKFWRTSIERRPPPTFKGRINPVLIIADHTFMKMLPEMHLGPRKSP